MPKNTHTTKSNMSPVRSSHRGLFAHNDEKPTRASRKNLNQNIFIAKIQRINEERQTMDVVTIDNSQVLTDILITPGYQGPMGFMGVMPEKGAIVVLFKGTQGTLIPISYFIPDVETANSYELVERFPESVSDSVAELNRVVPSRTRRMRSGEGRLASAQGSELFLDKHVELEDSSGNYLRLRAGDGSAIITSQQNFMFSNGVFRSAGPIIRNALRLGQNGEMPSGVEASEVIHSDGTRAVYVGGGYGHRGTVRNEYRIEVEDYNRLHRPVNDINEFSNETQRNPAVIFSMGNMVGNDSHDDATYGKFLAPYFISESRGDGRLNFEALTPTGGEDTISTRGVAWGYLVKGKSFFGVDKSGVKHEYLSESRGKFTGLSQITVARGGKREEWGASREDNISWDMMTKGGIRWVIGKSLDNPERNKIPRSAEIRYLAGTYTEHGFSSEFNPKIVRYIRGENKGKVLERQDSATYRRVERVAGSSRDEIQNHFERVVGGDEYKKVAGSKDTSVGGAFGESSTGDRTISTMGAFTVNATTEVKLMTQQRSEKILAGSDEKTILSGDETLDIALGSKKTTVGIGDVEVTVGVGDISEDIGAGNRSFRIGAGNFDVSVGAGSISLSTVGSVTIAGTSFTVSSAEASIDSAFVGLGNIASRSGVITMLSHKDYITGAPLIPSFTVTAGM